MGNAHDNCGQNESFQDIISVGFFFKIGLGSYRPIIIIYKNNHNLVQFSGRMSLASEASETLTVVSN